MLIDCDFIGNRARSGGAHAAFNETSSEITNCRFFNNRGRYSGAAFGGFESNMTYTNCIFAGNRSSPGLALSAHTVTGSAVSVTSDSHAALTNCSVVNNHTGLFGGAVSVHPFADGLVKRNELATATLANCILWHNSTNGLINEGAQIFISDDGDFSATLNYCDVQGWTGALGGEGNFGLDPRFVDRLGPDGIAGTIDDDLRLAPGSPCIDAGSNFAFPIGIFIDLLGQPRFVDDPLTRDTGIGRPPIIDLGAYEFQLE